MAQFRGAVIGLGWMGMLYDLAQRMGQWHVDDVDRPMPDDVDIHRQFHHHNHPGTSGIPTSYAEAIHLRPEVDLVAAADRDVKRLKIFSERYGIDTVYEDASAMLLKEKPDIVAVATNTKDRAALTCLAVECGAKGILTEKPMVHTLEEADRMVKVCSDAGVPLNCGSIPTTDPAFLKAKELVGEGHIGEVVSMESSGPSAQDQNWTYFLDSAPLWVVGVGDDPRRESGSDEFKGQGMLVSEAGPVVHFRAGAPRLRVTGTEGEITFVYPHGFRLWQTHTVRGSSGAVEMPWPAPQFLPPFGGVYSLNDVLDCLAGRLDEPKNSGRRVAIALEVEIALKQSSAQEGKRIDFPLTERSLGLNYDWFR